MTVVARPSQHLKQFVDFPFALYSDGRYPNWVPPLKSTVRDALDIEKNPFYRDAARECFVALREGRVVGRIAAIENRTANRFHNDKVGYWGFFECENDPEAAGALFRAAAEWLAARGLTSMLGPVNPSTNYECGVLVGGFENRPTFMTPWNPPYYDTLCTGAGLAKSKDLLGLWFPVGEPGFAFPEFVDKLCERALSKSKVEFRDLDPAHFARDLNLCWGIYNAAWDDNWGFVPMPEEEFRHMAKDMKYLVRKEWSFLATVDGVPAAFMLGLPDYNEVLRDNRSGNTIPFGIARMLHHKNRAKSARVMALGVRPEFRSRGILALFTREIGNRGMSIGGVGAEASWLLEDNTMIVQPMRAMGARDRMRWRLYERAVGNEG
jgi:GNAT superfamily N-acetyltransferase